MFARQERICLVIRKLKIWKAKNSETKNPETKNPEKKKSGKEKIRKNLQYPYNEGEQIVIFHKYVVLTSSTIS